MRCTAFSPANVRCSPRYSYDGRSKHIFSLWTQPTVVDKPTPTTHSRNSRNTRHLSGVLDILGKSDTLHLVCSTHCLYLSLHGNFPCVHIGRRNAENDKRTDQPSHSTAILTPRLSSDLAATGRCLAWQEEAHHLSYIFDLHGSVKS